MEQVCSMESEFLEQWNAKFGAKPPEWVFTLTSQYSAQSLPEQDVDRALDNCQARIDKLRADLEQELFLVEWLRQQKANFSSALSKPPTSTKTQNSHVQSEGQGQAGGLCSQADDQPTEQSPNLSDKVEEDKETSPKPSSPSGLPGGHSPTSQPRSHSEESFKSTPESCEYHTAPQSVGGDSSGAELEDQQKESSTRPASTDEVKENGSSGAPDTSCRQRFAHKVNTKDITIAKAVNRRLLEQQRVHWSCNVLNLDSAGDKLSSADIQPLFRKRCASDPSSQRSEESELLFELKSNGGKRVLSSPIESPQLSKKSLQKIDNSAKENLKSSATESSTTSTSDKLEKVVNSQRAEGDLKIVMTSEVEKRSSKEEDSIELRQWANFGPGKRSSNGILDTCNYIVSPDEERDPALLNVLATRIRSSAHSTPRSSIDHLREPPPEATTANGDSESKDNSSSPQKPSYNTQQTLVAELSPGRGVPPALSKPERASLVFSEDECITPKGDSDHSMNMPTEEDDLRTKDRSQTLVGPQEETLSTKNVSRVEKLLEEVRKTQDEEEEEDPAMMTLTRKNTDKFQNYGIDPEMDDSSQEFITPLGSLDIDIQETLSKIQSTPDMSMATLLDVGENKEMNAHLQASYTDPSLEDFEYTQGIDDATISVLTLSHELFGSRSNSVSSLPGLYSNTESTTSISPPDMDSPLHARQGVNLRNTGGARRRDRKRMGNAELDMITGASDEGSDLSPSHTVSSRSMSPTSELGSLASLTMSPSSPREFSGSDSSGGMADTMYSQSQSPTTRASRMFPVRRSTVVVHGGEELVIRKLVLAGILSAEKTYLDCLSVIKEYYRKPLLARATTSQPIISERDINTMFYRIEDLCELHLNLSAKLEPSLENWSTKTCVSGFFVQLCRSLKLYKDYVEMYRTSVECLKKHRQENENFQQFIETVQATVAVSYKEVPKINELLRRPIERLQSYSLVLNDLCMHTPDSHPDYRILKESLHTMSDFITSTHDPQSFRQLSGGFNRELVKEGLVVELSDDIRKVRRLFLFHDVLISSKQKATRGGLKFEPKWSLPLCDLSFSPPEDNLEAHRPVPVTSDMELSVMKNKIAELKAQLNKDAPRERSASSSGEKEQGFTFKRTLKGHISVIKNKQAEKVKKKLQEQQVSFWVASPSLPLRIYGRNGKQSVFLLHNEEEREDWVSAIKKLQPKAVSGVSLTSFELQDLLSRQTINDLRKVEEMISPTIDDEYLSGVLRVRVTSANGLKAKPMGIYCCLELDEYGKFERKARTCPVTMDNATLISTWDQDFELELAGAHVMRVQICSKSLLKEETYAHGKIRLPIKELKQNKRQKLEVKLFPQGAITLILEYFTSMASISRKPSMLSSGVFCVPIEVVSKRERHDIPLIVQTCVDEVEKRGLTEVGVYRVAGVLRDVEELRQAFDTDYLKAQMIAFDTDIHAVAGLLKRYFRELPDPLFTDALYTSFVQALGLSDPEAREQSLLTLLHSLPPVNFKTAVFLFKHLRRVAMNSSENKMSLNNLATIFGPNLLHPGTTTMEAFLMDVVTPVSVVLFFLNCPEEYFDESLFRASPDSTQAASSAPSQPQESQVSQVSKMFGGSRRESGGSVRHRPRKDEEDLGDISVKGVLRRSARRSSKGNTTAKTQSASSLRSYKESVI